MRVRPLPSRLNHRISKVLLKKVELDGSRPIHERLSIEVYTDDVPTTNLASRFNAITLSDEVIGSFQPELYNTHSLPDDVFTRNVVLTNQNFNLENSLLTVEYLDTTTDFLEDDLILKVDPPFNAVDVGKARLTVSPTWIPYDRVTPPERSYESVLRLRDLNEVQLGQFTALVPNSPLEFQTFYEVFNESLYAKNIPNQIFTGHLKYQSNLGLDLPDAYPAYYLILSSKVNELVEFANEDALFSTGTRPATAPYVLGFGLDDQPPLNAGALNTIFESDLFNYTVSSEKISACYNDILFALTRSGKTLVTGDIIRFPTPIDAASGAIPFALNNSGRFYPCNGSEQLIEQSRELYTILNHPQPHNRWMDFWSFEKQVDPFAQYPNSPLSSVLPVPQGFNIYGGGTPWWNQYDFNDNPNPPPVFPTSFPYTNPEHGDVDNNTYLHFYLKAPISPNEFAFQRQTSIDPEGVSDNRSTDSHLSDLERLYDSHFAITNNHLYLIGGRYSRLSVSYSDVNPNLFYVQPGGPSPAIYHTRFNLEFNATEGADGDIYNWVDYNGNHGALNDNTFSWKKWATFKSTQINTTAQRQNTQALAEPFEVGSVMVYAGRMMVIGTRDPDNNADSVETTSLYVSNLNEFGSNSEGHIGSTGPAASKPFTEPHQILPLPVVSCKGVCIGPYLYYLMGQSPDSLRPGLSGPKDLYRSWIPSLRTDGGTSWPITRPMLYKANAFPTNVSLTQATPVLIKNKLYLIGGKNNQSSTESITFYCATVDQTTYDLSDFTVYPGITLPPDLIQPISGSVINDENYGIFVTRSHLYVLWYTRASVAAEKVTLRLSAYPIDSNGDLSAPSVIWTASNIAFGDFSGSEVEMAGFRMPRWRGRIQVAINGNKLILGFPNQPGTSLASTDYIETFGPALDRLDYQEHLKQDDLNNERNERNIRDVMRRTMNIVTVNYTGGRNNYFEHIPSPIPTGFDGIDIGASPSEDLPAQNLTGELPPEPTPSPSSLTDTYTVPDLSQEDQTYTYGLRSFIKR